MASAQAKSQRQVSKRFCISVLPAVVLIFCQKRERPLLYTLSLRLATMPFELHSFHHAEQSLTAAVFKRDRRTRDRTDQTGPWLPAIPVAWIREGAR